MEENKNPNKFFRTLGIIFFLLVVFYFVPIPCPFCGAKGEWKAKNMSGKSRTEHCRLCHGSGALTLVKFIEGPCR